MTDTALAVAPAPRVSLVAKMAERFSVEPSKLMGTLKATAFKGDKPVTDEQMMALLIVADQYRLNPFTKEIFAFPDKGGIVPVVSVDGWSRIINEHPQFDGVEFVLGFDPDDGMFCTCILYRKDRSHPTRVTEYLTECKRGTAPWNTWPRRMLRHKSLIQCARLAFGFAGIYDEDEAARIISMGAADEVLPGPPSASAAKVSQILKPAPAVVEDAQPAKAPTPEPFTFERYASSLLDCTDSEVAALVLDEARSSDLTPEEQDQLAAIYRDKFNAGA